MKYALISDVHANLEALNTVLESIEAIGVDSILCLGDAIGYGANPEECANIIREKCDICLMGNHEAAVVGNLDISYFTPYAKDAALWTRNNISQETLHWASDLPLTSSMNNFTLIHGSLYQPEMFNYVQTIADAEYNFNVLETNLLFLGHSHQPLAFFNTKPMTYTLGPEIELDNSDKVIVNIGSVGQPRDENPLSCYAIYDSEAKMVELFRVEYDYKKTADKIIAAGLPEALALRLSIGR